MFLCCTLEVFSTFSGFKYLGSSLLSPRDCYFEGLGSPQRCGHDETAFLRHFHFVESVV